MSESARARVHAMFPLDEMAEQELDARLDALVAETRNEDAALLQERAARYPSRRIFAAGLRHGALMIAKLAMGRSTVETPDFFISGHVYAREHHGRRIEFHVRYVDIAPDCDFPTAFGWRKDPEMPCVLPMDSDDLGGWVDVTEEVDR